MSQIEFAEVINRQKQTRILLDPLINSEFEQITLGYLKNLTFIWLVLFNNYLTSDETRSKFLWSKISKRDQPT